MALANSDQCADCSEVFQDDSSSSPSLYNIRNPEGDGGEGKPRTESHEFVLLEYGELNLLLLTQHTEEVDNR